MSVILITGASSGIGYQVAKFLAKEGNRVYGGARHVDKMASLKQWGVTPIKLDVTKRESCQKCVKRIIDDNDRIDVLLNAGRVTVHSVR